MVELGKGTKRSRSQDSKETFKRSTSLSTSSTKDSWRIRSSENELAFVSVAPRNEIRTCAGVGVTLRERERERVRFERKKSLSEFRATVRSAAQ